CRSVAGGRHSPHPGCQRRRCRMVLLYALDALAHSPSLVRDADSGARQLAAYYPAVRTGACRYARLHQRRHRQTRCVDCWADHLMATITIRTGDAPDLESFLAQRIYEYNAAATGYHYGDR